MKKNLLLWGTLLAGVGAGTTAFVVHRSTPPPYSCTAGDNEKCASDQWYSDYERFVTLRTELNPKPKFSEAEIKHKTDEMQGLLNRLRIDAPPGYDWDEKKVRFVKHPMPPTPPPAPPVPPPPAK
jgi:hypothetical protein